MRQTLSIFRLSLRAILRERVAVSMLGLLALVLLLLPAGLRGDGTLEGAIRMQIRYSLGFSFALLSGMTLWVSCASIAGDLSSKRLHMILAKPVGRAAVWWGKWLAVTTLVTALGILCGAATWIRVHREVARAELTPEELEDLFSRVLTARRPADAAIQDLRGEAESLFTEQMAAGAIPAHAEAENVVPQLEQYLRVERNAVEPGATTSWSFPLSRTLKQGETLQLAYTHNGSAMGPVQVPGRWRIVAEDGRAPLEFPVDETPRGEHVIPFTVPPGMDGVTGLEVHFENQSETNDKVFFRPDRGVRIYRGGGGFGLNLFRAVLLQSGLLAILAAIGVGAGSVFSLPVACYSASVVLMLRLFSGVVADVVERGVPEPGDTPWIIARFDALRLVFFKMLLLIMRPLHVENPLARVAGGVLIPTSELAAVLLLRFLPVVLGVFLVGIALFAKREAGEAA